ncbi:unnamed protein product [Urochloa humidicola]
MCAAMRQPAVTEAELVDALAQRKPGLPPPPSQPFTVHDVYIFNSESDPSRLYDTYGAGADCVYFFCEMFTCNDSWKVTAGTQPVLDGGALVFHEGRWLPRMSWAMDEFRTEYHEGFKFSLCWMRLYRLRRLDA